MVNLFKIHPSIGIARLGDSTTDFCLAPETRMGLPLKCDKHGCTSLDADGREQSAETLKDSQGRIKRQAARFRVYVYADDRQPGRELKMGDEVRVRYPQTGELCRASVLDIEWTVHLANKKASWYHFDETQEAPSQILRNASISDAAARQRLIIDPGPQTVSYVLATMRHAEFTKGKNHAFSQSFPSALTPHNVETLGEIMVNQQDGFNRLIVLGGHGRSGSFRTGFGETRLESARSTDGWFDDVSDGPVTANLWVQPLLENGDPQPDTDPFQVAVDDPAWALVAYPGYVPEIESMVTLDDIIYDLSLREMDADPEIYSLSSVDGWNKKFTPHFYRDIWPILSRPNIYEWVMSRDPQSIAAAERGNLDHGLIAIPPFAGQDPQQARINDAQRRYIFDILRQPARENLLSPSPEALGYQPPLIPQLFGETPIDEEMQPSLFHLTETQLFFLQKWADGNFINEETNRLPAEDGGHELDRIALWNVLGGAFCAGGEVCWIIRNPTIYGKPYRIKHAPYEPGALSHPAAAPANLDRGLEPGDLTKYSTVPWQADFNECARQDMDISYENWTHGYRTKASDPNPIDVETGAFWWPAHRPMEVFLPMRDPANPNHALSSGQASWTRARAHSHRVENLQMLTSWAAFGFIHDTNPAVS